MYKVAKMSSVCLNIPKYAIHICAPMHRTLCVSSSVTMKAQVASSISHVNDSVRWKVLRPTPIKKQYTFRPFSSDAEDIAAAEIWLVGAISELF